MSEEPKQRRYQGSKGTPRQTETAKGLDGCPTPTKTGYYRRADAKRKARINVNGRHGDSHRLCVYLCGCGLFHIGNQAKNLSRADYAR